MSVWTEVLVIKKYTQRCWTPILLGFWNHQKGAKKTKLEKKGMQGKGDKGQKGRYIFTPPPYLRCSLKRLLRLWVHRTGTHAQGKKKKQAQIKIKKRSGQLYLKIQRALHSTPEDKTMQCPAASAMLLCDQMYTNTQSIWFP